jgi:hypothetical protein
MPDRACADAIFFVLWTGCPFRVPELMPCEDLWRLTKAVVEANRVYELGDSWVIRAEVWNERVRGGRLP